MKIIITINPAEDKNGQEMVLFSYDRTNNSDDSLAVMRATARFELVIGQEYAKLHAESKIVKMLLEESVE